MKALTIDAVRHRYVTLQALRWLPVGFIAPLLVLVLVDRGLSLAQVGPVLAVYGVTTAVLELPTGGLADAYGRKPVLLWSAAFGVAFLGSILILDTMAGFIVAAFLGGVSRALDSGPLESWFVDSTRAIDAEADLSRGLSLAGSLDGAALALGAIIGGFLPAFFDGNFDIPVIVAVAFQVIYFVAVAVLMVEPRPSSRPSSREAFAAVPHVVRSGVSLGLHHRHLRRMLAAFVAFGFGLVTVELLWQPRFAELLSDIDTQTGLLGILLAGAFLAAATGAMAAPRLREATGLSTSAALAAATVANGAAIGSLAFAGTTLPTAVLFVASYFFHGVANPYLGELLHEHVPAERRTTMVSVRSLTFQTGGFIGSSLMGAFAQAQGIPAAWIIAGAVVVASSVLYWGIPDRPASASLSEAPGTAPRPGPSERPSPP